MTLSRTAIEELKKIYKDAYGKELSDDDAWEMGHRLLRVFDVLTRPLDEPKRRRPQCVDGIRRKA